MKRPLSKWERERQVARAKFDGALRAANKALAVLLSCTFPMSLNNVARATVLKAHDVVAGNVARLPKGKKK